jgi:hypothetical protein
MTITTQLPATAPRPPGVRPGQSRTSLIALLVAVAASAALIVRMPHHDTPAPPGRVFLAVAWPGAQRADIPPNLRDGPLFTPLYFFDVHTALGTAPTPGGRAVRLLIRLADGSLRLLRTRPLSESPEFGNAALSGSTLVWSESVPGRPLEIWSADLRGGAARRLTADTGNAAFYGTQYDLVIADGRVYWTARSSKGMDTQIRSVPLTGGAVHVRLERGAWGMTAWPWIVEGGPDNTGSTRLRDLTRSYDVQVARTGAGLTTCSPSWCRVMVQSGTGLARIDLMHPDGSGRRQVADGAAGEAITDVALLDRFEILAEAEPNSDLTGTERILIFDLRTGRTVDIGAGISGVFARGPVMWWSTGDQETMTWHTLDLRTV